MVTGDRPAFFGDPWHPLAPPQSGGARTAPGVCVGVPTPAVDDALMGWSVVYAIAFACVHDVKEKRLELWTPNLVYI